MPRHSSITACKAELGRYPLIINIVKKLLTYYNNIISKDPSTLIYKAYIAQVKMYCSSKCNNWFSFINTIYNRIYKTYSHLQIDEKIENTNSIVTKLKSIYEKHIFDTISASSKLHVYKQIKHNFITESYLYLITNPNQRRTITRLRTSAHKLPIETGRYTNIPPDQRKCPLCNEISDEIHFILLCNNQELIYHREKLLSTITSIKPSIALLDKSSLFKYLFMFHDKDLLPKTSSLIVKIYELYLTMINVTC
jgi:hypothetical protein